MGGDFILPLGRGYLFCLTPFARGSAKRFAINAEIILYFFLRKFTYGKAGSIVKGEKF